LGVPWAPEAASAHHATIGQAMDFWSHQDNARRSSVGLLLLFVLVVALISVLGALCASFFYELFFGPTGPGAASGPGSPFFSRFMSTSFLVPLVLIPAFVCVSSFFSFVYSGSNGRNVAETLKGVQVGLGTIDLRKKRLNNVVEEMALASGSPVPPVYVLDDDESINAFAAGRTINDAVIGVSSGALKYLTRAELQAVIAHEFSHIINGDMRINLRFAQLLFGLMCLSGFGRICIQAAGRGSGGRDGRVRILALLFGLLFMVLGLFTSFFGNIIQAAINRQREYLADASSVQFTRSNELASALKKIGGLPRGSRLKRTPMTANYSHMFFCKTGSGLFSTHPSLAERIRRLDPAWNGTFTKTMPSDDSDWKAHTGEVLFRSASPLQVAAVAGLLQSLGENQSGAAPAPARAEIAGAKIDAPVESGVREHWEKLLQACHEPLSACCLIFALLLHEQPELRKQQLAVFRNGAEGLDSMLDYRRSLDIVGDSIFLPLIELAIPTLKAISEEQYRVIISAMMHCIHADGRVSFREWAISQLFISQVGAQFEKFKAKMPRMVTRDKRLQEAAMTLLAVLARRNPDAAAANAAYAAGTSVLWITKPMPPETDPERWSDAVALLQHGPMKMKKLFLESSLAVARHDQRLEPDESVFLHVLSLCLGVPVPDDSMRIGRAK
ncbi:M48 family metallopeptidase, partial [Desulfovibrio sp. OttesenSCG-928-A18]|nr:M48 family metallopeptidase [Desulfovibrio sp. OttesenSCG-928-A18]